MASLGAHSRQRSLLYYPEAKRRRVQVSESGSYDGPNDKLTLIQHTYEADRQDIEDTLRKYDIEADDKDLALRHIETLPTSDAVLTLYIQTPLGIEYPAANQRNCVAELHELLRRHKMLGQGVVTVELIGYRLWAQKRISHLEVDHPFHQVWKNDLRDSFRNFLDLPGKLVGKVWSVDLVRLGFDLRTPLNNPVVVSITVDWSIDPPEYKTIKAAMILLLQEVNFPTVQVEFERGEIFLNVEMQPELKMLTPAQAAFPYIRPGSSISKGIAKTPGPNERAIGTIGVVMEIVNAKSSEVVCTVALTNYHVARTALKGFVLPRTNEKTGKQVWLTAETGSVCAKLDDYGYWEPTQEHGLKKDVLPHVYRSPSLQAISRSIEAAETLIASKNNSLDPSLREYSRKVVQDEISKLESLISILNDPKYPVQELGRIFYSGGLSRKHSGGGRLDLAGILIEGDVLKNASNDISHRADEWTQYHKPAEDVIDRLHTTFGKDDAPPFTAEVFRVGAVTGCTHSTITSKKVSMVHFGGHTDKDWSYEVAAVGQAGVSADPSSWRGDSGSACFDLGGRLLGLVYGGQCKLNTIQPLTYIVPTFAILEDIKAMSNGKCEARLKV